MPAECPSAQPALAALEIGGAERARSPGAVTAGGLQGSAMLKLPGVCTFAQVAELRGRLLEHLGAEDGLRVDASAVERIDTAGLQLLTAFVRDRKAAGRTTQWSERSAAFEAAVSRLALHRLLAIGG